MCFSAAQNWSNPYMRLQNFVSRIKQSVFIAIFFENICSDLESNRSFINFLVQHPTNSANWIHAPNPYKSFQNMIKDGETRIQQNNLISSCSSLPKGPKQIFNI